MITTQISPQEFHLFKKEVETLGEDLTEEKLERRLQVNQLKVELEAIKQVLAEHWPDFLEQCEKSYSKILMEFNPEMNSTQNRQTG